ncbi:MAG: DUF2141 domain-containing protein [Ideonella sp. WA131b]|nr:DUF2141 domain-containing protein [Ideonella sp. WA131b]
MKSAAALSAVISTAALSLLGAALLATAPPAQAQDGCATVEVQNVRPNQGQLMVAAFGSADSYRKKPLAQLRLPAGEGATMRFQLCGMAGSTEVALTLFQDLDSDGRMGANIVGLPTEPWGSSGTPGTFGPSWETGRVKLDGSVIVVRMST